MIIAQPSRGGLRHNQLHNTPSLGEGFSLLELVIVISILGVLVSVAIPYFTNVQRDAQISQAKNSIATVVKECMVSVIRSDANPAMQSISSVKGSLSGYVFKSLGATSLGNCVKSNLSGEQVISIEAVPDVPSGQDPLAEMPSFLITQYLADGRVVRECSVESYTKYKAGCSRGFGVTRVCAGPYGLNNCPANLIVEIPDDPVGRW